MSLIEKLRRQVKAAKIAEEKQKSAYRLKKEKNDKRQAQLGRKHAKDKLPDVLAEIEARSKRGETEYDCLVITHRDVEQHGWAGPRDTSYMERLVELLRKEGLKVTESEQYTPMDSDSGYPAERSYWFKISWKEEACDGLRKRAR
jgi:hypothetical protein